MSELDLLNRVIKTLSGITVRGKEDCGAMFDCIYALEQLRNAVTERNAEAKTPEAKGTEKPEEG